jgi:predicted nucleic acid binding AN1-type Zn finger protein
MDQDRRIKKYFKYFVKKDICVYIYVYIYLDVKLESTPRKPISKPEKRIPSTDDCDICYTKANQPVKCKNCKTTFCMEHILKVYYEVFFF